MTGTIERERIGMISCAKCNALNSLDGSFCRKCGEPLPEAELQGASEKLDELVAEGFKVLSQGNQAEAMMIANSAITTNPSHIRALSLKGMCHERSGNVAEALECYELVLALDPDSALDRIKVNHLRNLLASHLSVEPAPVNRRLALTGAVAAVVLVMAGAAYIGVVGSGGRPRQTASLDSSASLEPIKIQQQTPPNQEAGAQAAGQEPASTQANQGPTREPVLPDAIAGAQPAPEGTTPFQIPGLQGQIGLRETQDPAQPPQEQRHPPAPADNAIDPPPPIEETPRENNGIVDIRISSGSPSLGGTQPAPNNLEALLQAARSQYMLGRYPEAARTFERALQAGGDAGAINQRLGQCYEKMGQPTQAVAAYQKAIAAYEAVERSGAGGERVKTALDATRQALRVLQGSS